MLVREDVREELDHVLVREDGMGELAHACA